MQCTMHSDIFPEKPFPILKTIPGVNDDNPFLTVMHKNPFLNQQNKWEQLAKLSTL